jgi:hypothetical protein
LVRIIRGESVYCYHPDWLVSIELSQSDVFQKVSTGEVPGPASVDQCIVDVDDIMICVNG